MANQVYNSWGNAFRLTWSVPRATRSYLVEQVLSPGITSVRTDILAKYVGFFRSLRISPSHEVSFMAHLVSRDLRSVTGRNLRMVEDETGLSPWLQTPAKVKQVIASVKEDLPAIELALLGTRKLYQDRSLQKRCQSWVVRNIPYFLD